MEVSSQHKKLSYDRLVRSGRWHEAKAWKEALRVGPPKTDAGEAWLAMEKKFLPGEYLSELEQLDEGIEPFVPPEPNLPEPEDLTDKEVEHLIAVSGGEVDMRRDIEWAYSNYSHDDLSATDAPTVGAWNMVEFARANTSKFMELAIRELTKKKPGEVEDNWEDDGKPLKLMDGLLERAAAAAQDVSSK